MAILRHCTTEKIVAWEYHESQFNQNNYDAHSLCAYPELQRVTEKFLYDGIHYHWLTVYAVSSPVLVRFAMIQGATGLNVLRHFNSICDMVSLCIAPTISVTVFIETIPTLIGTGYTKLCSKIAKWKRKITQYESRISACSTSSVSSGYNSDNLSQMLSDNVSQSESRIQMFQLQYLAWFSLFYNWTLENCSSIMALSPTHTQPTLMLSRIT